MYNMNINIILCILVVILTFLYYVFKHYKGHNQKFNMVKDNDVNTLISELKNSSDPSVRMAAARGLGETGDKLAEQHLIEALNDEYNHVRYQAVLALVDLLGKDSIDALITALHIEFERVVNAGGTDISNRNKPGLSTWSEYENEIRGDPYKQAKFVFVTIIEKLGEVANSKALPHLIQVFKNEVVLSDSGIWTYIIEAFGKIGDEGACGYVAAVFRNQPETYRKLAAEVLGAIGGKEAISALNLALKNEGSIEVKETIIKALENAKRNQKAELKYAVEPSSANAPGSGAREKEEKSSWDIKNERIDELLKRAYSFAREQNAKGAFQTLAWLWDDLKDPLDPRYKKALELYSRAYCPHCNIGDRDALQLFSNFCHPGSGHAK